MYLICRLYKIGFLVYCFLLLLSINLEAQTTHAPFSLVHFTTDHGLSQNYITGIIQDRRGFIWIGTWNGLNRFDGYNFVYYKNRQGDSLSLSNNFINDIVEDKEGNIWIGTNDGLNRFDYETGTFRQFRHPHIKSEGLTRYQVTSVFDDGNGVLWLGAFNVLDKFDPKTGLVSHYFPPVNVQLFGDEYCYIADIIEFQQDLFVSVWGAGVFRFNRNSNTFHSVTTPHKTNLSKTWIHDFHLTPDKQLLSIEGNVLRYQSDNNSFLPITNTSYSDAFNEIHTVHSIKSGQYLVGTMGNGIKVYDSDFEISDHFLLDPDQSNQTNNFVNTLFEDACGEIWAGTSGNGLFKFDLQKRKIQIFRNDPLQPNSLVDNNIFSLKVLESGNVWIGTRLKGISIYDPIQQTFTHLRNQSSNPNSLNSNFIKSFYQDKQNIIWIGTWGGGLNRYDPVTGKFSFLAEAKTPTSLCDNFVTSICESTDRKLWVATANGVAVLNMDDWESGIFKNYLYKNDDNSGPNDRRNNVVYADHRGTIWLGTEAGGLNRYNPQTDTFDYFLHNPNQINSLGGSKVQCIFEDSKHRLWIGCSGGGLNLFVPETEQFIHFTETNGLPNDDIKAIQEDAKGRLWISTDAGISCFYPETQTFKNYNLQDGLPSNQFTVQALGFNKMDGKIYAGTKEGVAVFHPDSIPNSTFLPPVYITSFKKYRTEGDNIITQQIQGVETLQQIELSHLENTFNIVFSALNYRNSAKNKYAYQLQGLNENWVELGTTREVTFSNLPSGKYMLRVKASNNDGVWNETGTTLSIIIRPPWWKTFWAMILWVSLLIGFVVQLYRFQLKRKLDHAEAIRLRELDLLKSRLYTNITHEFRTPLTVILGMTDQIEPNVASEQKDAISMIKRNGKNLLQLINQLLDLSKLEDKSLQLNMQRGNIIPFLHYLTSSFQSYANTQNLALRFFSPIESLEMDFDPVQLQHVMSNLIANALKFTPSGGEVYVRIEQTNEHCQISIHDTGIGIAEKDLPHIFERFYQVDSSSTHAGEGTGIGLAYVKELVKLMNGSILVESQSGKGSVFKISLPITKTAVASEKIIFPTTTTDYVGQTNTVAPANVELPEDSPLLLIIEDNPDVVSYLKACLQNTYRLSIAYNGEIGIQKALDEIPDLIVSDVMMPGKDGYEVCHHLKNDERTSHIPIVLLTAKAEQKDKLIGLKHGADAYLSKPFDREELMIRLEKLNEQRKRIINRFTASLSDWVTQQTTSANEDLDSLEEDFTKEDAFIEKLKIILADNIEDDNFALPQLCQKIGMSRSQLFRKMKALINQSPSDFIRTYRLQKAKHLLSTTDLTVSEISYQVGYKDLAHFSKSFFDEFGTNPSATRK